MCQNKNYIKIESLSNSEGCQKKKKMCQNQACQKLNHVKIKCQNKMCLKFKSVSKSKLYPNQKCVNIKCLVKNQVFQNKKLVKIESVS